jgi:hypothetical protein
MDNALSAFEILHHMKCKRKGKIGEVALKLDISKAFDSVSWSYLLAVMAKMGFCEQWVLSMKMCITSVNYHVLLNGERIGPSLRLGVSGKRALFHPIPISYVQRVSQR